MRLRLRAALSFIASQYNAVRSRPRLALPALAGVVTIAGPALLESRPEPVRTVARPQPNVMEQGQDLPRSVAASERISCRARSPLPPGATSCPAARAGVSRAARTWTSSWWPSMGASLGLPRSSSRMGASSHPPTRCRTQRERREQPSRPMCRWRSSPKRSRGLTTSGA